MPRKPTAEYDIKARDGSAAGWRQALKTADSAGKKLTGVMKTAFAGISIAAFTGAIKGAIEFGDEIGKAATKAGIGAKQMSELAFAARMSDIDIGSLSTSIRKMQVELSKASTGGKEQKEALAALGLSIDDLKKLKADEQFEVIGDAISRLRDPTDRARAATVLFGRAGADLLPLFEKGAAGIRAAREEAIRIGAALSDEQVRLLQEGDDAIKKLGAAWDGWMAKLAVGTVKFAQAIDLIESDVATEAWDRLEAAHERLDSLLRKANTGTVTQSELDAALLEKRLAEAAVFRSGPSSRGGPAKRTATPPGFTPEGMAAFSRDDFDKLMEDADLRRNIQDAAEWRATIDEVDRSTRKWFEGTADLTDELQDLPEPILKLSNSLIQADELQKEFTRNMYDNFRDLFMHIGDGADDFKDSMINAFKGILADRATLELFNMLSGLGDSLTSSSEGKGFWGAVGSFLTTTFGGGKAKGGPLDSGKWYIAGEHGPEPIWGGGSGAFAMGYGGAASIDARLYVDARGATKDGAQELMKAMPEILRRHGDQIEARIVQRLKARKYG